MKCLFTILIFLCTLFQLEAQTILPRVDSVKQKLEKGKVKKTVLLDSVSSAGKTFIDKALPIEKKNQPQAGVDMDSVSLKNQALYEKRYSKDLIEHKLDSINRVSDKNNEYQSKLSFIDTVSSKVDHAIEKMNTPEKILEHGMDSVRNRITKKSKQKFGKADSLQLSVKNKEDHFKDSLNEVVSKYQSKVQATKLTSKIDSLKQANLPYDKYTNKLDSIEKVNPLQKAQAGIGKEQSKIQQLGEAPAKAINDKISLLSKESGGKGNLPANVKLPETNLNVNGLGSGIKLPDTKLNTALTTPNSSAIKTPDINITKDLPKANVVGNLKSDIDLNKVDELNKLKSGTTELNSVTGKVSGYNTDLKNIKSGKVEETKNIQNTIVSKLPVGNELMAMQAQEKALKDQQARLNSYKNPEEYRRQTKARARQMIAQQMATYGNKMQESVTKLSKYQRSLGTVLSTTSEMSRKRDSWRKLKSFEKFVPGVTWQIQRLGSITMVDLNPSLRYRLTTYWSIGAGWNERLAVSGHSLTSNEVRIYGPRIFTEVIVFKGISVRLDAEDINTFQTPQVQPTSEQKRVWTWNYMAGIKKDFSFIPHVTGNVQFMYKAYSSNHSRLYASPYNIRFGFEYMFKRKLKKSKTDN